MTNIKFTKYKHDTKVEVVRVNGKKSTTEVKQIKTKDNTKMGDHLGFIHFVFFQFGSDWQKF